MNGIIYFTHGQSHLARLAVSLWTLRNHYTGPICILNGGQDDGIVHRIACDPRIGATVAPAQVTQRKRHTAYCAKPSLWRWTPYERNLYLDADTIVAKDPSSLLEMVGKTAAARLVVTRFADWVTTGRIYSSRISQWRKVSEPGINILAMAEHSLKNTFPAINTGVFGFERNNPDLQLWEAVTKAGGETCSFTDELALQILLPKFGGHLVDDHFNASPLYHKCATEDVVVWHFHGCKNLRKDAGKVLWWPVFEEVLKENVGGIKDWFRADKSLRGIEATV